VAGSIGVISSRAAEFAYSAAATIEAFLSSSFDFSFVTPPSLSSA
jgi:hypothetical protein